MDVQKNLRTIYATIRRIKATVQCMNDGTNATEKCRDCEPCKCREAMIRILKDKKRARKRF